MLCNICIKKMRTKEVVAWTEQYNLFVFGKIKKGPQRICNNCKEENKARQEGLDKIPPTEDKKKACMSQDDLDEKDEEAE